MPTDVRAAGILAVLAAFLAGVGTAVQGRANGTLGSVLGSPIDAALWSMGSGWLLLTLAFLHPAVRRGLGRARQAYRTGGLRWWQFLGGLGGGTFIAVQTWTVPELGVALFTIALVGGQTANALLVDGLGLGPAGRAPITLGRVLAAVGTFAGVALAMSGRSTGTGAGGAALGAIVLAVAAGAGMAVQQAVNGRVNQYSRNVLTTTWVNFTWGMSLLVGLALVDLARGALRPPASADAPWWAYTGGLLGVVFVAVNAVVVGRLGVLQAVLLTLAGQLTGAVLVDAVSGVPVSHLTVGGAAVTLLTAAGAAVAARRASSASSTSRPGPHLDTLGHRQPHQAGVSRPPRVP